MAVGRHRAAPAISAGRGRLVVFGALIAVLVLLCTGQAAGAAERQPAQSQHAQSQQAQSQHAQSQSASSQHSAAVAEAAAHGAAARKAAARKAAAHRAALRRAAEHRAGQASASQSSDAARPAAASRLLSQDAAKRHPTKPVHRVQQSQQHRQKAAEQGAAKQSLADRKQAAADARDDRQLNQDSVGSVDSPAAVPARSQSAAEAAAQATARLASARKAADQAAAKAAERLAGQQAQQASNQPTTGQPVREVGIRSPGTAGSTGTRQPVVSLSPGAASHPSPAARPRPSHPSGSLPRRIITEPAEPIVALATASLSVGSMPALLVLAIIAIAGLLLVAAGTRRSWLHG